MKKYICLSLLLIGTASVTFFCTKSFFGNCDLDKIHEMHFINPKYSEPSFQYYLALSLKDSLKNLKQPYDKDKIESVIKNIELKSKLKNFITLIGFTQNDYKILVTNNEVKKINEAFYLIKNDTVYYTKSFNIVRDLKN